MEAQLRREATAQEQARAAAAAAQEQARAAEEQARAVAEAAARDARIAAERAERVHALIRRRLATNVKRARKRCAIRRITAAAASAANAIHELARLVGKLEPLAREHYLPGPRIEERLDRLRVSDERDLLSELGRVGGAFGRVLHPILHDRASALVHEQDELDRKRSNGAEKRETAIDPLKWCSSVAALSSMLPLLHFFHGACAPLGKMHLDPSVISCGG